MSRSRKWIAMILVCMVAVGCSGAAVGTGRPQAPPQNPIPPARPPVQPLPPAATAVPAPPAPGVPYPAPVDFEDAGVNPFVDPLRDPLSTFAMDVDTAAYAITRRFLQDGFMPDRDSVRLEEFVNSFDYGYAGPSDSAFAVHLDGGPTPFTSTRSVMLRITAR